MSLVPEEQEPATPTGDPAQAKATETMNLDAIAGLQADKLQKLTESLQGLAAARQEPTRQPPVQTETTSAEEEIRWEQLGAGRLPASEEPQARPPPTQNTVSTQPLARENPQSKPLPPPQAAAFAEVCSKQQRTDSLAAYPSIFDLQESDITATTERIEILASLLQHERPALLIIVEDPTRHIRVLWGIEKLPYSYAKKIALDGHILAFSRDIVAGNTPPTIAVNKEWWRCVSRDDVS